MGLKMNEKKCIVERRHTRANKMRAPEKFSRCKVNLSLKIFCLDNAT